MAPDEMEVLICQTENGKAALEARLDHETVWLSLNQIAALLLPGIYYLKPRIRKILRVMCNKPQFVTQGCSREQAVNGRQRASGLGYKSAPSVRHRKVNR